jgi:hypothetical protein
VGRACGKYGIGEKNVQGFGGKARRPHARPRRRWKDGIRIDLRETDWGVWSGLNWLRTGTDGGLL